MLPAGSLINSNTNRINEKNAVFTMGRLRSTGFIHDYEAGRRNVDGREANFLFFLEATPPSFLDNPMATG